MNRVVQTLAVGHQQRRLLFQSILAVVQGKSCRRHLDLQRSHPIQLFRARCHAACFSSHTAARHSLDLLAAPAQDRHWHFFVLSHFCELPGSHELVVMLRVHRVLRLTSGSLLILRVFNFQGERPGTREGYRGLHQFCDVEWILARDRKRRTFCSTETLTFSSGLSTE